MNYTTITINGEKIGLKFGMASFRYLAEKFDKKKSFVNQALTEIEISHILYSGYYNNCLVKEVEPTLTFENFVDYIEMNMLNEEVLTNIKEAIELWSKNDFLKTQGEEPKKKNSRGKK